MKIIIVTGLPGSGKTEWAKAKKQEIESEGDFVFLFDDISAKMNIKDLPRVESNWVIITDVMLCFESARKSCEKKLGDIFPAATIEWVFFENDPEQCLENVKTRTGDNRRVDRFIQMLTKFYVPEGTPLPVWRPKLD